MARPSFFSVSAELLNEIDSLAEDLLEAFAPGEQKRNWDALSAKQRQRYIGSGRRGSLTGRPQTPGQVRRYYERGGNLGGGRGYHPPKGSAPRRATVASSDGRASPKDLTDLKKWRRTQAPAWIPKSNSVMRDDTAALLSQLGTAPRNWKDVRISPSPDGDGFIMRVTTKRGAQRMILLPDRDSVSEVSAMMNNPLGMARTAKERREMARQWQRANGEPWSFTVTITGTDPKIPRMSGVFPTAQVDNPLPKRKTRKKK